MHFAARAGRARRRLELPLHRRHDAGHERLPARGEDHAPRRRWTRSIFTTMTLTSFSSGALDHDPAAGPGSTSARWCRCASPACALALAGAAPARRSARAAAEPAGRGRSGRSSRLSALSLAPARRAGDEVEAEQAAFDRPVPHRHAARLLQPHRARQLHVGAEHPGGPAGRVRGVGALPVRGQAREEVARQLAVLAVARRRRVARLRRPRARRRALRRRCARRRAG